MKRFIKWLADITGLTRDIEYSAYREVGNRLLMQSYWFNGGITYDYSINSVQNFMVLYGERLKDGYFFPDISRIRDDIYRAEKEGLNLNVDREVFGYWNREENYFIPIENLEQELRDPLSPIFGAKKEDLRPQMRIKWKN